VVVLEFLGVIHPFGPDMPAPGHTHLLGSLNLMEWHALIEGGYSGHLGREI
jgi:hypothetical protein